MDRYTKALLEGLMQGEKGIGSRPEVEARRRLLDEVLARVDEELAAVARLRELIAEAA